MSQGFIAQYAAEAALHTEGVSALSKGAITTLKEAFGLGSKVKACVFLFAEKLPMM